jgi:hypothetical protein
MKHTIPHDLDQAMAKRVVDRAFAEYSTRFAEYQPHLRWVSDKRAEVGFNAKGVKLSGAMELEPASIGVELDVPFLFRPFQKKALEVIGDEVRRWVGKARAGELG